MCSVIFRVADLCQERDKAVRGACCVLFYFLPVLPLSSFFTASLVSSAGRWNVLNKDWASCLPCLALCPKGCKLRWRSKWLSNVWINNIVTHHGPWKLASKTRPLNWFFPFHFPFLNRWDMCLFPLISAELSWLNNSHSRRCRLYATFSSCVYSPFFLRE